MTTSAPAHEYTTADAQPWAWTRALAFATASLVIGSAQHVIGGTQLTAATLVWLLFVWMMLAAYARVFATERLTKRVTIPALLVGQIAVHALMVLTMPTMTHHHDMAHAAHTAAAQHGGFELPSMTMFAFHVVATLVGAALLKRLDQIAWRTVRAVVRAAVVALYEFIASLGTPRIASTRRPSRLVSVRTPAQHWVTRALGLRGPPFVIATR